jgi:hypothetical protein
LRFGSAPSPPRTSSVAHFGPGASIYNAFWLIGLTLVLRDRLHDQWSEHRVPKMAALIVAGGVLAYLVTPSAGKIGLASGIAFAASESVDAIVYQAVHKWPWLERSNTSNFFGAAVDSLVFPTIAFGGSCGRSRRRPVHGEGRRGAALHARDTARPQPSSGDRVMHYHGTPITPRETLLRLVGRCFCVPYSTPTDVAVCHEIGQSVMLDNGAFSVWKKVQKGEKLSARLQAVAGGDWSGFYAWCEPWLEHWTTWAVIPDVIVGDEADNDALLAEWPFGRRGVPVWHMHEDLGRLERLCDEWPMVCIGSSGAFAQVNSPIWKRRLADALDRVCDSDGRPRAPLHMLRGLQFSGGLYPFASADSTSIAQNHAGNNVRATPRKDVVRMADYFDGRQTPARWVRASTEQLEMVA